MKPYLTLILLLPLLGATINSLVGRLLPRRVVETIACGTVWGSFAAAAGAFALYRTPVTVELASWLSVFDFKAPLTLYLDPLSLSLTVMITFVCGLIHLYSVAYMADDPGYVRFFALLNLFVCAMLVLVLAENLPLLYLGWEGVGFCSYALIGFWYKDTKNADAGRKAFITTRIGDTALGIAIIWLFQLFGTVSITELNTMGFLIPAGVVTTLGILFLIGAMGKSAQVPLMVWLPDAMAGPTPVSALIHAATMVTAGVYLLARMLPFIGGSATALAAIAITGGVTAFFGASCALAQRDLKRVLAYSTISQIGYMILGVGAGAVTAATFHLLIHAFFKALLFLGAGCIITALHHEQDIFRMGGVRRSMPGTFWPFLAGTFCLAGVPLTGGFFSKDSILAAVWERGGALYGGLYLLGLATAYITALYSFRLLYLVFAGEPHTPPFEKGGPGGISDAAHKQIPLDPPFPKGEALFQLPRLMELTLLPLALLGLGGGLLNLPEFLGHSVLTDLLAPVTGPPHHAKAGTELLLQGAATIACLAGFLVARTRYAGAARQTRISEAEQEPTGLTAFLLYGWYVDRLYRTLIIRPYERLAGILWQTVDEGIIDDSLDRFADLLGRTGQWLGRWTSGRVSVYLLSLAAGAALVMGYLVWVLFR
ncbi:NADH-quinone oxidoreductase subunit L [Geobacter argillaceus]|uniref:NADH dehydrogenase subunit L n=1 Tax=Geobacter argillaceus TaxID=345631 RepID=A0A562VM72_9BACT|nr:NADH-quinone oxidoreductase subunit L [Geobacter argillaceus]TWJ18881.1 NADH dehydrogenase subunit L [Geobacter argillaceus]